MADNQPPATIKDLLAKVQQSTANIQAHRDAMAAVAAQVRNPQGEVKKP
jgi:ABC-type nitrate/sulfonate/bicarbonate transport system substrate-binding protein